MFFFNIFIKFYSLILIILLSLLYPFFKIKIGHIRTKTIGNGSISLEIFYYETMNNIHPKSINLWYHDKKISNQFILDRFKKKFIIVPGIFLFHVHEYIIKFKLNFLKVPMRKWTNLEGLFNLKKIEQICPCKDIYNVLTKNKPFIEFNNHEHEKAKKILSNLNLNIDDKIVCLSTRTPNYKNEKYTSVRNGKIENLITTARYLVSRGYKVVFVGDKYEGIENEKNDNIILYSNSKYKSDFMDFYLIYLSKFLIQCPSGIGQIAVMMRKPRLIVNYFSLEQVYTETYHEPTLIIPKKIKKIKNDTFISYSEFLRERISIIKTCELLKERGFIAYDNTDEEILSATKEMIDTIENKNYFIDNSDQKFWIEYNEIFNGLGPKEARISEDFYNLNKSLFEA